MARPPRPVVAADVGEEPLPQPPRHSCNSGVADEEVELQAESLELADGRIHRYLLAMFGRLAAYPIGRTPAWRPCSSATA